MPREQKLSTYVCFAHYSNCINFFLLKKKQQQKNITDLQNIRY